MIVKLLTEHHLEFLSLKGGCRGSPEPTLVKMSNCWKSLVTAHGKLLNMQRVFCLIVIVALRPKSTTMAMAGWSVHLTTLFLGKLEQAVNQYCVHTLSLATDSNHS